MNQPPTPKQAFDALKILYPTMTYIFRKGQNLVLSNGPQRVTLEPRPIIEWPSKVYGWPLNEPETTEPTEKNIGDQVEVRNYESDEWQTRILLAILPEGMHSRFICQAKNDPKSFGSWGYARVSDAKPEPEYLPVSNQDIGKWVGVSNDNQTWCVRILKNIAIYSGSYIPTTIEYKCWSDENKEYTDTWKYARKRNPKYPQTKSIYTVPTADHLGKKIEVRVDSHQPWEERTLLAIDSNGYYLTKEDEGIFSGLTFSWSNARVKQTQ